MSKLKIEGIPPYDGEYDMPASLNKGELHYIKQISGVRAGELEDAMTAGDIAVFVALTAVALKRNGHPDVKLDPLWDSEDDAIDAGHRDSDGVWHSVAEPGYVDPDVEEEKRPLVSSPTPNGQPNSDAVGPNEDTNIEPSGQTSTSTGDERLNLLRATGSHG